MLARPRLQASSLDKHASRDVKVLVVANPANTNAAILRENAPSIPPANITCLTRLDHNRALAQVALRAGGHMKGRTAPATLKLVAHCDCVEALPAVLHS